MRICALGFLVRNGCVLLARRSLDRSFYPGVWDAPGGHVEAGESPSDTLSRELGEELGIQPLGIEHLLVLDEPNPNDYGPAEYHVFVVTAWRGGEPTLSGGEHSALRWCTLEQALAMDLAHPRYAAVLEQILRSP